jgi:hypothetical protein
VAVVTGYASETPRTPLSRWIAIDISAPPDENDLMGALDALGTAANDSGNVASTHRTEA